MADVHGELMDVLRRHGYFAHTPVVNEILERWDLKPKPVVTDDELGGMVSSAFAGGDVSDRPLQGEIFRRLLERAGLTIARIEEGGE